MLAVLRWTRGLMVTQHFRTPADSTKVMAIATDAWQRHRSSNKVWRVVIYLSLPAAHEHYSIYNVFCTSGGRIMQMTILWYCKCPWHRVALIYDVKSGHVNMITMEALWARALFLHLVNQWPRPGRIASRYSRQVQCCMCRAIYYDLLIAVRLRSTFRAAERNNWYIITL